MFKEFFQSIKSFDEENKWLRFRWMKFEFYFRQPFGMASLLVLIIIRLIQNDSREGYIPIAALGIDLLVWMLLLFFCMLRKKYSFYCLMAVFVLQSISIPLTVGVSLWSILIAVILFLALFLYYSKREDFFFKEREERGINKRNAIIGGAIGASLVVVTIAMLLCIKAWNYRNMPAKVTEGVVTVLDEAWTIEQAEVIARKWTNAVEMDDTEEIQEIIEEMLVEQEEKVKCFFFFKKSEFQAGIDQKKCSDVLACIDAEKQGVAYYSLARIGHYYDVQSKKHEPEVEVKQSGDRLLVTVCHGKAEAEIEFVDMNEAVGEEGKGSLKKKGFSDEDITSVLSSIYTDEDISFVEELVKATDKEAYAQVFKRDPDKLSAAGQEALYQYAYVLLCNNIKYDKNLYITEVNLKSLEVFSNGILQTLSNRKKEDYCERYLKVLSDKGQYQMNAVADHMCENYNQKDVVVKLLPEFCLNTELNVLFNIFERRIDYKKIYKNNHTMQVKNLNFMVEVDNLLDDYITYEEVTQSGRKDKQDQTVYLNKYTGSSIYLKRLKQGINEKTERDIWLWLYGDIIDSYLSYGITDFYIEGVHDANNILKAEWLRREGLSFLARPELKDLMIKEFYLEGIEQSEVENQFYSRLFSWSADAAEIIKKKEVVPFSYLIWTGNPYKYENGKKSKWSDISDLSSLEVTLCMNYLNYVGIWIDHDNGNPWFPNISASDYVEYDIIEDYYFNDEE